MAAELGTLKHPLLTRPTGRPELHTSSPGVFFAQGPGFVAMASPSSVCLGCHLLRSCSCSSLVSCWLLVVLMYSSSVLLCVPWSAMCVVFVPTCSASCCCLCRGGFRRGWLCMFAVSVSSLLLALLKAKPDRCFPVHSMPASSFLVPSYCFLSTGWFCVCLFSGARARVATATLRPKLYVFLRRSLADSRPPLRVRSLAPFWHLSSLPMAEAAAPAAPRQQRRKEARAQAQDDSCRVRQRLEDLELRLETLEGRSRGHDLRLQYLEAPLTLVLKKFKAPVGGKGYRLPGCKVCILASFPAGVARIWWGHDPTSFGS